LQCAEQTAGAIGRLEDACGKEFIEPKAVRIQPDKRADHPDDAGQAKQADFKMTDDTYPHYSTPVATAHRCFSTI
jgi:hypothetical protein